VVLNMSRSWYLSDFSLSRLFTFCSTFASLAFCCSLILSLFFSALSLSFFSLDVEVDCIGVLAPVLLMPAVDKVEDPSTEGVVVVVRQ